MTVPPDAAGFERQLQMHFPSEAAGISLFFEQIAAVYREMYAEIEESGGVPRPPATLEAMLAWPATHPHAWRWMKQPYAALLGEYLRDPHLKHLLTTLAEYVTDRPETLTVADMAPLFGYYFDGGYYPAGGSQSLADLLAAVIGEHGGQVRLRTPVARILVENGQAASIRTADGTHHRAPLILAAGDVQAMLTNLLGDEHLPAGYRDKLEKLRRGPSAIILNLGIDQSPALPARIFVRHEGLEFGIGNPSAIDSSLAPPGHAALTMLYLLSEADSVAWNRETARYAAEKNAFAERMIDAAEATVWPGLRDHIVYRQVAGPPTFTRYAGTRNGNIYGAARGQWCPGTRSPVPGLMLVGAGTSSGAGIEAVVVSGMIAAAAIAGEG